MGMKWGFIWHSSSRFAEDLHIHGGVADQSKIANNYRGDRCAFEVLHHVEVNSFKD